MDSIHFHFHGNVSIHLALPEDTSTLVRLMTEDGEAKDSTPDRYRKLVDSLEKYLHDAADERVTPAHDTDSIVMVMRPNEPPEVMLESECFEEVESRGCYDSLEVVSDDVLDVSGLMIVFDGRRVLTLGKERYLLGPVIVYRSDKEGDGVSLTAEEVIAAVVYFTDHTVTLCADGQKEFPAFHI